MIFLDEFEPATWSVSISRTAWWGSESLLLVGVVSVSINVANFGAGVAREEDLAACPALDGIESLAVVLLAMDQCEYLVVALLAEVVPDLGLGPLPRVYDMLAVARLRSGVPPLLGCWGSSRPLTYQLFGNEFVESTLAVIRRGPGGDELVYAQSES